MTSNANKTLSAAQIVNRITWIEVGVPRRSADLVRVLQVERVAISAALRSRDVRWIAAARAEALRVAEMWGVSL